MSSDSPRGQRIQASCKIIWGDHYYDLDLETDDYEYYSVVVKKDFGDSFGPPLTMTPFCHGQEAAWTEL